jgi:4-amino-4-deoxychorismate lyase
MLDNDGELISATSGNVFLVKNEVLCTPDLQSSGVRGVMRQHVLATARSLGIAVEEQALWPADLEAADEVFITNAVRGVRPVISLHQREWALGAVTRRLQQAVAQ